MHEKDTNIRISVIMPSYNVAPYIRECVESVMSQSIRDIEILCVDAGSTDGTLEILEECAETDSRIHLIHSEKKSYGYQMNYAINEARGDYIGIVETDDYIDERMFEILYHVANANNVDVVKAIPWNVYELDSGEEIRIPNDYIPKNVRTGVPISISDEPSMYVWDGNIWNGIYRRTFLLENHIVFNETPGAAFQDIGFSNMVLAMAGSVIYLRIHLYNYRIFRKGSSILSNECLHNACVEYKWLLDNNSAELFSSTYFQQRMLQIFFVELEKIFYICGFDGQKIPFPEDIEWFRIKILEALRKEPLLIERLDGKNKENIKLFIGNRSLWYDEQKKMISAVNNWYEGIKQMLVGREFVIFGVGNYGMLLFRSLLKNGLVPICFSDNACDMKSADICGISIFSADEAVLRHRDALFIVANRKSCEEINAQLVGLGVLCCNILLFDGSDKYLINGLERMNLPVISEISRSYTDE